MSFGFLKRLRRTIGFRLTLWYAAIFICSSLALFILAYFFLASSLRQKDHELILAKLKVLEIQYHTGGLGAIRREIRLEENAGKPNAFFIRLATPANRTLFLNLPDQWADFDLNSLEDGGRAVPGWNFLRSRDDENGLEIATIRLEDGAFLQVGKNTDSREDLLETFRGVFAGSALVIILLGFGAGYFLTNRALQPIRRINDTVSAINTTGNMEARLPVIRTGDELDDLSRLVNQMLARIETLIAGMKETLDNVAHDLRTPMTRLRGMAEMALAGDRSPEACREALSDCLEESERVLAMLNTLMDLSEAETGTMHLDVEQVNLSELLAGVIELYRDVADDKQLIIKANYPAELYLIGDRKRLQQTMANLMDNAIKYTPAGGRITVEAMEVPGQSVVMIKDSGPGIPPEEVDRIWDRLYRGDQSRSQRGLGLGLSLVKAIIAAHHGRVEVASQPDAGSLFTVYLPRHLS